MECVVVIRDIFFCLWSVEFRGASFFAGFWNGKIDEVFCYNREVVRDFHIMKNVKITKNISLQTQLCAKDPAGASSWSVVSCSIVRMCIAAYGRRGRVDVADAQLGVSGCIARATASMTRGLYCRQLALEVHRGA